MVVKLQWGENVSGGGFESCVILNGSKTYLSSCIKLVLFESCVILNGSKTYKMRLARKQQFESCVILDGSKTWKYASAYS